MAEERGLPFLDMLDADDLAVLTAMALREMGTPFKFVLKGDGIDWVSVEAIPTRS